MIAIELQVQFFLPGCRSLKDKRGRLRGLRDRFGKQTGMAVCESASADDHQRSVWSFVAVAAAAKPVAQMLDEVERYLQFEVDAQVLSIERHTLSAGYTSMADAQGAGSEPR